MASGWARRGFSSALRWSAVGTAGVTGIAGAQAWALHARYDPLPDARGPTRGVASPQIGRSRAETSHSAAGEALMKARDEAREFFELKVRPRLERLEGRTSRLSSKDDPSLVSAATTSMQRMIKNKKDSSSGLTRTLRRTRRVVIVGDSLVTGVGCRVDRCDGPMLPRRLGEVLAELIGADVEWVAVGAKVRASFYFRTVRVISELTSCLFIQQGADLAAIRRDVVPALKRRAESHDGSSSSSTHEHDDSGYTHTHKPIDAVVLMCGVNDFKHALSGRTAVSFHADLVACVDEVSLFLFIRMGNVNDVFFKLKIKSVVGSDCWVILPGMPMQLATIFPPPLSYLAVYASTVWDEQKRKMCHELARVRFVPSPR